MKTFREYLSESKKQFAFRVKIAGDVPEKFAENLKKHLSDVNCTSFSEGKKMPIASLPLDFPDHEDGKEVTTFEVVTEYPTTPDQIATHIVEMGLDRHCFRVKTVNDPSELEQEEFVAEKSGESLLGVDVKDKIKAKDYFGDEFNKGFLQQLSKDAKARKKELGQNETKNVDVLGSAMKVKQDKAGAASPVGSK